MAKKAGQPAPGGPAPRQRGDARRSSLLATAAHLFLREGFEGVSVGAIARAARASKETVYRYFATKEELFVAALLHRGNEMAAEITPPLRADDLPAKALRQFGAKLLRWMQREEFFLFYRTLAMEHGRFPGLAPAFYEMGPVRVQAALEVYLRAQIAKGTLRRHNAAASARHLFHLMAAETMMRGEMGLDSALTGSVIKQHVREAVDCFLWGYGAPAKTAARASRNRREGSAVASFTNRPSGPRRD